jgi:hypothetical protein
MDKRYQVFVSSTYADLREERQEVIQALLELDCIPAGMELFPAADDDQWTLIRKVIDDCDYYIVILAGRYGSLGPGGKSYTQMEYEYAVEKGKPVIAFLHENPQKIPAEHTESAESGRASLLAFRELVQKKTCRYWSSKEALGSVVSRSLVKLIKTKPGVGWVRADMVPTDATAQEILKLRRKVEELQDKLEQSLLAPPIGSDELSQGEDELSVRFNIRTVVQDGHKGSRFGHYLVIVKMTWNDIFALWGPLMLDEGSEPSLRLSLRHYFQSRWGEAVANRIGETIELLSIDDEDFGTIKVQLRALGLIEIKKKNRSTRDKSTYWGLTPYGDKIVTQLRAVRPNVKPVHKDLGYQISQLSRSHW